MSTSPSTDSQPKSRYEEFGDQLRQVLWAAQNDRPNSPWGEPRRVMAHLRRGVTFQPRDFNQMLPFLAPFLSEAEDDPADHWFFVVAALAASHKSFDPKHYPPGQSALAGRVGGSATPNFALMCGALCRIAGLQRTRTAAPSARSDRDHGHPKIAACAALGPTAARFGYYRLERFATARAKPLGQRVLQAPRNRRPRKQG